MALIQSTAIPSGATDYELEQSLKFNDDDSAYLSWTPSSAGNRKTWTWSGWLKRGNLSTYQTIFAVDNGSTEIAECYWDGSDNSIFWHLGGGSNYRFYTNAIYRDSSAWYHIVCSLDTTISSPSGNNTRMKLYVNGEQVTSFRSNTTPSLNYEGLVNLNTQHEIGKRNGTHNPLDGYLAEVNFIDGQALTPADFGETGDYGEWKPIEYSGTYGTNGFYLPFKQDYTVEGFSTVTYRGTGASQYIGGVGFQPDFVWFKGRSNNDEPRIMDSVRGLHKTFKPHQNVAEDNDETNGLTGYSADGVSIGNQATINTSGNTYVVWSWDMGGSNATNTSGTITSTVRANPTYGQSIVSYTGNATAGATVGHGLSSAPEMMIIKNRDKAVDWIAWHEALADDHHLRLHDTHAAINSSTRFNSTDPSSTVFTLGTQDDTNSLNENMIAYCFHSVTGYSKFGSYTGNASTNAVTTGFAPAFVMLKDTTGSGHSWEMHDSVRGADFGLLANESDAENTSGTDVIDFTDTGFTLKNSNGNLNGSGNTYIYMAFADKREYAYWLDQSGNNNDWTSNNLTESDISVDSPTNNFATIVPAAPLTLKEGNLNVKHRSGTYWDGCHASMGVSSGKWYWETKLNAATSAWASASQRIQAGFVGNPEQWSTVFNNLAVSGADPAGDTTSSHPAYMISTWDSNFPMYGTDVYSAEGIGIPANNDILNVALDLDNNKAYFGKNGVYYDNDGSTDGNPSTGANPSVDSVISSTYYPGGLIGWGGGDEGELTFNFGQDSSFGGTKTAQGNQDGNDIGDFYYTPPTGFLALCTKNLPDVAVVPSEHFNTVLYTAATSAGTYQITGVGFQPDFTWVKNRDNVEKHLLFDSVRGNTSMTDKFLVSNSTAAEGTNGVSSTITVNSDGFQVVDSNVDAGELYFNNRTYVAWNWKANGSGSSNTDGDVTSTVSANVDSGFSIVTYTGNGNNIDVGHGLSKAPDIVIVKERNSTGGWYANVKNIPSQSAGTDMVAVLNQNYALNGYNVGQWYFGGQAPTSSVFRVQNKDDVGANGSTYVAYCFHSVDGYSKVGSYEGNANADGTFVYTGFRPAMVIIKEADNANDWHLIDNKREAELGNPVQAWLRPNTSNVEASSDNDIDLLSNGFKARTSANRTNRAATLIYIAFSETPFKYSNAR